MQDWGEIKDQGTRWTHPANFYPVSTTPNPFEVNYSAFNSSTSAGAAIVLSTAFGGSAPPAGNRQIFTHSVWLEYNSTESADLNIVAAASTDPLGVNADQLYVDHGGGTPRLTFTFNASGSTSYTVLSSSSASFSLSSWTHVVAAVDLTQAVDVDRVKLYANAVNVSDSAGSVYPATNYQTMFGTSESLYTLWVGEAGRSIDTNYYFTEIAYVDGQQLTPASFTSSGLPADLSGLTWGTAGAWHRVTADITALGLDYSGNNNNALNFGFTSANISTNVP